MFRVEAQWTGGTFGEMHDDFTTARGYAVMRVCEGAVAADVIDNATGEIVFTYEYPCSA